MRSLEKHCNTLARRQSQQHMLDAAAAIAVASCLAAATLLILLRLALPALAWLDTGLLTAALLLPLLALPRHWRHHEAPRQLAARIDRSVGSQGLAMALSDQPAAQRSSHWSEQLDDQLDDYEAPPLSLLALRAPCAAAACLLIAFVLPQVPMPPLEIPDPVAALFEPAEERLATFEEESLMPPEELQEEKQQLQELRDKAASDGMDQQHWQALDQFMRQLDRRATAAARRLAENLFQAEQMAASQQPDSEQLAALAEQLSQMAAESPGLMPKPLGDGSNPGEALLREALRRGALSEQQLQQLQQAGMCRNPGMGGEGMSAEQMAAAAAQLAKQLAERREALRRLQAEGVLEQHLADMRSGRGGVNRGPGHAQLNLDHDGQDDGSGRIQDLQAEAILNADGSITIGTQQREAELDDATRSALQRAAARRFDPTAADAQRAEVRNFHF